MNPNSHHAILDRLSRSQIFCDYERAFGEATGLPLALGPVEGWNLVQYSRRNENPFCALLARQNKSCAACLCAQHELASTAQNEGRTVKCFAGLLETAIPLRVGDQLIGFLRTGEVLPHRPTAQGFAGVVRKLAALGMKVNVEKLRDAYFHSHVFSPKRYDSALKLLEIFAQHLCLVATQIVFQSENAEPPCITKAREFINANHTEDITLPIVARAVHMSTFYFCKQFKKATGLSFTEYLSRLRVEKAKEQLLKPNVRVSEVAFEVGFQSLTHFNRVFRKLSGESPTCFRAQPVLADVA